MKLNEMSLKDYFLDELLREIMSGEKKAGDNLLSIRDYSDLYHVSRSVIQNGLRDLHDAGIIEKDCNNHYIVMNFNKYDKLETLLYLLHFHSSQNLHKDDIKSFLEFKYGMDCLAIDLIGTSLKETDFNRLMDILNPCLNVKNSDYASCGACNYMKFMKEFYLLTNNTLLLLFLNAFKNVPQTIVLEYCRNTKPDDLYKATKEMLEALYNKDLVLAKQIIKDRFLIPIKEDSI